MNTLYPLLFQPNLHQLVWGGNKLRDWKKLNGIPDSIGESWEVSAVKGKESIIANGALAGMNLADVCAEYRERLMGKAVWEKYNGEFPLLAKFIDAKSDLSIQVHPDDELARERHDCFGKNEMWLILDAEPDANIYSGLKDTISKYEYQKRVEDGSICTVLKNHHAHPGDMFYIPAGRVHAIGGGILLAEIQQSSDITYRIFDYNRPGLDGKPRQLHTELAVDAINFNVEADYRTHYSIRHNKPTHAITSPYFQLNLLDIDGPTTRHLRKCDSFIIYMCTHGECSISPEANPDDTILLHEGYSCLVPAEIADMVIKPTSPHTSLIEAFIDNYNPWHKGLVSQLATIIRRE